MIRTEENIVYLAKTLAHLSGVPVRVYRNTQKTHFFSTMALPVDPILPWEETILQATEHVSSYFTTDFDCYGIVCCDEWHLVTGPTRETPRSESELRTLAFALSVPEIDLELFLLGMHYITPMPTASMLERLCSINFALHPGEKLTLADLTIHEEEQEALFRELTGKEMKAQEFLPIWDDDGNYRRPAHNTISVENELMDIVTHGDLPRLQSWMKDVPPVRPGVTAPDPLRQAKNMLIVTTTLVSRAAIRGGMPTEAALSLSDAYISKCEQFQTVDRVTNLMMHMVEDYTERVWRITAGENVSDLVKGVSNYILQHLSDAIRTEQIADALYVSRGHLSTSFKEETGINLSDFIHQKKIEEAKRLLKYTDRSLTDISSYLGYSSQSHFSRTFRIIAGCSPKEYRK